MNTHFLAELRRLAEAATPGPWAARYGVSWEARVCATTGSLADVDSTANDALIAQWTAAKLYGPTPLVELTITRC